MVESIPTQLLVLTSLGLLVVALQLALCFWRGVSLGQKLGGLAAAAVLLAALTGNWASGPQQGTTLESPDATPPVSLTGNDGKRRSLPLPIDDEALAPPETQFVSLDRGGLDLAALAAVSGRRGRWLVLRADAGVLDEYTPWVTRHLGTVTTAPEPSTAPVCWRKTTNFPVATTVCEERSIGHVITAAREAIAGAGRDRTTASIARVDDAVVVLMTHSPAAAPSAEESCLAAAAQAQACAVLDELPGIANAAVVLLPSDAAGGRITDEFALPSQMAAPSTQPSVLATGCGGVLSGTARLQLLSVESQLLRDARSDGDLDPVVDALARTEICGAYTALTLPEVDGERTRGLLRSLLARAQEQPVWLTTSLSIEARLAKLERAALTWQRETRTLTANTAERIPELAVSMLLPRPYSDRQVEELRVEGSGPWQAYRSGEHGVRLVWTDFTGRAEVDAGKLIGARATARDAVLGPLRRHAYGLSLALILALAANLVQAIARSNWSPRRIFHPGTVVPVFLMSFVWTASAMDMDKVRPWSKAASSFREPSGARPVLQLGEVPDAWLPEPSDIASGKQALDPAAQIAQWERDADAAPIDESLAQTVVLDPAQVPVLVERGTGGMALWDSLAARNHYFRRSSEYQSALTGWQLLLKSEGGRMLELDDQHVEQGVSSEVKLIVAPEIRTASAGALSALQTFVAAGGHLLVGEVASDASHRPAWPTPAASQNAELAQALAQIGLGRSVASGYSSFRIGFGAPSVLQSMHQAQTDKRHGFPAWLRSTRLGAGAVHWLGLSPGTAASNAATLVVLRGLLGERVAAPRQNDACLGALLLEPFGTNVKALRAFVQNARSAGIAVNWLVDARSMVRMLPNWGRELSPAQTALADQGTAKSRTIGAALWKKAHPEAAGPYFATAASNGRPRDRRTLGPGGFALGYVNASAVGDLPSCESGFAPAALLPAASVASSQADWLAALRASGRKFVDVRTYADALTRAAAITKDQLQAGEIPTTSWRARHDAPHTRDASQ